jgi:hypothetical protein
MSTSPLERYHEIVVAKLVDRRGQVRVSSQLLMLGPVEVVASLQCS